MKIVNSSFLKNAILVPFILIVTSFQLFSATTGKITGTVTNNRTGEPICAATISLEGTWLNATTNTDGRYFINNAPPGTYVITIQMIGYKNMKIENVMVRIGLTSYLDFQLEEEEKGGEEIFDTGEPPVMVHNLTFCRNVLLYKEINQMPVESIRDILQLQPGVIKDDNGELHFRGGRAGEVCYVVDGIVVNDAFAGNVVTLPGKNAIQQMEILTGMFNAEYGRAMSGVVNIITPTGREKYHGGISAYSGDYLTRHSNLFINSDNINLFDNKTLELDLGGPIPFIKNITLLLCGRYGETTGYLYGKRRFNPWDNRNFTGSKDIEIEQTGDGAYVPLNPDYNLTIMSKITWNMTNNSRLTYSLYTSDHDDRYDDAKLYHAYKYNPDGFYFQTKKSRHHGAIFTHTLNSRTFYNIYLSWLNSNFRRYVYQNPWDERYVGPIPVIPANSFLIGGNLPDQYYYNSKTAVVQGDITSQITDIHELKAGTEFRYNEYHEESFSLIFDKDYNSRRYIDRNASSSLNNTYYPIEAAVYVQDKMEYRSFVVNAGLRFDYFDSQGKVPIDYQDPGNTYHPEPTEDAYRQVKPRVRLSPRFGMSYQISERGFIHAAYGHFYQIPAYNTLYRGTDYRMTPGYLSTHIGNSELDYEKTVAYEIGMQQQLTTFLSANINLFKKDQSGLIGSQIEKTCSESDVYSRYINRHESDVKGLILVLNYHAGLLQISFDYTFQTAKGDASDPFKVLEDARANREYGERSYYLNWDQTQAINLVLGIEKPGDWNMGLIGRMGSGLPYTPAFPEQNGKPGTTNSGRRPDFYNLDFRAEKFFQLGARHYSLFCTIYNLFDLKNEIMVFNDTGRAGITRYTDYIDDKSERINSIDEYYTHPEWYSAPRIIKAGFCVRF